MFKWHVKQKNIGIFLTAKYCQLLSAVNQDTVINAIKKFSSSCFMAKLLCDYVLHKTTDTLSLLLLIIGLIIVRSSCFTKCTHQLFADNWSKQQGKLQVMVLWFWVLEQALRLLNIAFLCALYKHVTNPPAANVLYIYKYRLPWDPHRGLTWRRRSKWRLATQHRKIIPPLHE